MEKLTGYARTKKYYKPSSAKKLREEQELIALEKLLNSLAPGETMDNGEISEAIGVPKERIEYIVKSALRKLRQSILVEWI